MRLLALVDSPDHVCCRYRLAAFRPYLERAGHSLQLRAWPRHLWSWPSVLRAVRGADVLIVQRKLPASWQLRLLRRTARYLIFDLDDAIFGRDSFAAKGIACPRRQRRFAAISSAADAVIAGNDFLRQAAARCAPNDRVSVIPTCVDSARYFSARHGDNNFVELVWLGSSSTLRGLEAVQPLLEALGGGVPNLQLKLVCDRFLRLKNLPVRAVPWTETGEAAELASADIGISWMPDDDWSRGKCGLKVLQYMAAGLPVVANSVGVHGELVRHGENGYLAETPAEWFGAVRRLAGDADLRRRLGAAGRQRVEREYSVARGAALWTAALDSLPKRRRAA